MGLATAARILRGELEALDELAARGIAEGAPLHVIVTALAAIERERGEIMDALECLGDAGFEVGEWRPFAGGLIFAERDRTPDLFELAGGRA